MKATYKIVSLLIALLLVLGSMVGCSDHPDNSESSDVLPSDGNSTTSTTVSGIGNTDTSTTVSDIGNTDTSNTVDGSSGGTTTNNNGKGTSQNSQTPSTTRLTTTTVKPVKTDYSIGSVPAKLKGTTLTMFYYEDYAQTFGKQTIADFENKTGIDFKCLVASKNSYATDLTAMVALCRWPPLP